MGSLSSEEWLNRPGLMTKLEPESYYYALLAKPDELTPTQAVFVYPNGANLGIYPEDTISIFKDIDIRNNTITHAKLNNAELTNPIIKWTGDFYSLPDFPGAETSTVTFNAVTVKDQQVMGYDGSSKQIKVIKQIVPIRLTFENGLFRGYTKGR